MGIPNELLFIYNHCRIQEAFVEGVKLMHVRKSRVNATYSEGLDAVVILPR